MSKNRIKSKSLTEVEEKPTQQIIESKEMTKNVIVVDLEIECPRSHDDDNDITIQL